MADVRIISAPSIPGTLKWPLSRKTIGALKTERWAGINGQDVSEIPPRGEINLQVWGGGEYLAIGNRFILSRSQRDEYDREQLKDFVETRKNIFGAKTKGNCVVGALQGEIKSNNCLVVCMPFGSRNLIGKNSDGFVIVFSDNFIVPELSPGGFIGDSNYIRHNYSSDALVYGCTDTEVDNSDGLVVVGYNESGFNGCESATYVNRTDEKRKKITAVDSGGSVGINIDETTIENSYGASIVNGSRLVVKNSPRVRIENTSGKKIVSLPERTFIDNKEVEGIPRTVVQSIDVTRRNQGLIRETFEVAVGQLMRKIVKGRCKIKLAETWMSYFMPAIKSPSGMI